MKKLKIILTAIDIKLIEAWKSCFNGISSVEIINEDITKIKCDAIVSPANSFGFMDGGLDYQLSVRFGWDLEKRLQKLIYELPEGELLVGQALVVETLDKEIPFLISSPTMRIPTNFNIDTSVNAYLAMKAILIKAVNHEKIISVAIPGLCTGVGRMSAEIAANQMFLAFNDVIQNGKQTFKEFGEAQKHHRVINPLSMIWTH
jgi:O-acetyl-ADP-ribose deacetylase (regulator of RNase III)